MLPQAQKTVQLPALVTLRFEPKMTSGRKMKRGVNDLLIEEHYFNNSNVS